MCVKPNLRRCVLNPNCLSELFDIEQSKYTSESQPNAFSCVTENKGR